MSMRSRIERTLRRAWRSRFSLLSLLLLPLSWLFGLGAILRRRFWTPQARRVPVPVISVGNLVVGGAGKTPVTAEIGRRLLERGRRVAVLSRGYGRTSKQPVVVVSDGEAVGVTAADGGDEPVWLARVCPGLMVIVGAERSAAAQVAIELGADLLLLDDGFSHAKLARDVDVLVVDAELGLGNGRLLPAGPLREPVAAAARASFVWLTRARQDIALPGPLNRMPAMRSSYHPDRLADLELRPAEELTVLEGARVFGVCGIARPESFEQTLADLGANVRGVMPFPDHHPFTAADVEEIERHARAARCEWILTTEKDAIRLSPLVSDPRYRAVRMKVELLDAADPLDALLERFAPRHVSGEIA